MADKIRLVEEEWRRRHYELTQSLNVEFRRETKDAALVKALTEGMNRHVPAPQPPRARGRR